MGGPVSGILKGAVKEIDEYRDKYPMLYKAELTDAQRLLTETLSTMRHCAAALEQEGEGPLPTICTYP